MVYIPSWDLFYESAQKLYAANPTKTRYVIKYRHKDGKLVLKVTDNKTCIKYRATHTQSLKKLEQLNALFLRSATEKSK